MGPTVQQPRLSAQVRGDLLALEPASVQALQEVRLAAEARIGHGKAPADLAHQRRHDLVAQPARRLRGTYPQLVEDAQGGVLPGKSSLVVGRRPDHGSVHGNSMRLVVILALSAGMPSLDQRANARRSPLIIWPRHIVTLNCAAIWSSSDLPSIELFTSSSTSHRAPGTAPIKLSDRLAS
jgi:hypothetical protein